MLSKLLLPLALFGALGRAAPAEKRQSGGNPLKGELDALNQANVPNDAYAILPPYGLIFDFLDAPSFGGGGKGGGVVLADRNNFPGVIGQGQSMLMGFLGPCGMVAPHIHPRATEYLLNIAGPPMLGGVIPENGAPYFTGTFGPGNVTVLPQGSVHFVASTGCEPTLIAASFNAETPGVLLLTTAYNAIDPQSIDAAFGAMGATVYDESKIPKNVILGRDECLAKCGINRDTFDINSVPKKDLMQMAMAGWLKSENYDYDAEPWKAWGA